MLQVLEQASKPLSKRLNIGAGMVLLVFLVIAAARLLYVSLYASQLPFWDQWDELDHLFRPWRDGTWQWVELFAAHNEHRIALTRILGLILFVFNGHKFDNLVESDFNALLYAGMWALSYALMTRGETDRLRRLLLAVAIAALGALPFDWENTLVGFQSQFYLMEASAIALLGIASFYAPSGGKLVALLLVGIVGLFTMAAGVLAIPAACMVMALLAWRNRSQTAYSILTCMFLVGLTVVGLAIIPHTATDDAFKSRGIVEHAHALLVTLVWPMQGLRARTIAFGALVWTPTMVWAWRYLRHRQATEGEIFTIGICVWVLLQFLAIAHARGHAMESLSSRYTEIPALGVAANLWLALQLTVSMHRWRVATTCASVAGILLATYAFHLRTPSDHAAMVQRYEFSAIQARNVRSYLQGGALPPVPDGSLTLPYPSSSRLQSLLQMPDILSILPSMMFSSSATSPPPLSRYALSLQRMVRGWFADNGRELDNPLFSPATRALPTNAPAGFCAVDQITIDGARSTEHEVPVHKGNLLGFTGWITDNTRTAPSNFAIDLIGSDTDGYVLEASAGSARPDVAHALQSNSALDSGYSAMAQMKGVRAGSYRIVLVTPVSGHASVCATGRTLNVLH